ncbi:MULTISPECIES: helix-turn-helix domain-containing protein [Haloferax]|uniref:Bacterio-opsin activator n=1 Tax=Haloferax marinum TaxID=2666143 RepID=A0A6A8G6V9_9EURY|nr:MULTISPECIES: helix-turn-helix domain-containing protein [Haloferax]KAB1197816.1 bacterio-opsin activator [Haloferax sp. CBA1150]MRW96874.1 bacterio-opsin activator [Haloferax marinum]
MRELTFTLEYEPDANPVMDVLIDNPEVTAHALGSCASRDQLWFVERFSGPPNELDRIEQIRFDDDQKERMTRSTCGATRHHDVLESTPGSRVFYTYLREVHRCDSVVGNAARYLDLGMIFQSYRRDAFHTWRLLIRSEENVDTFFETVDDHLRDNITLHLDRLCEAKGWDIDSLSTVSVTEPQRKALQIAVERGYYESPRETTIEELASELDIPSSTLSYRLRRAEAELANGFIA